MKDQNNNINNSKGTARNTTKDNYSIPHTE